MNGTSVYISEDGTDFNDINDLVIANESIPADNSAFGGKIMYFSWVKGAALYTTNFTASNNYPTLTPAYILLLTASGFSGTLGNTVVNSNVSTIQNEPVNLRNLMPLFTDNSRVFYKPGSLASCGVGSVRNSSSKSRRI